MTPTSETTQAEEIEGLDDADDGALGDYPIDTFSIRTEMRTVFDVLRRIQKGAFVMHPDFQRDFIWSEDQQSRLIESVLMRIPLPVFYLAENTNGKLVVVDGLQRLSTFQRFCNDELRLKLPKQEELHRRCFRDLSSKLQNRVEDCNLTLYIIDANVPERARLDIFERVNSGQPLTRQQMRNCLYTGPATAFLKTETQLDLFRQATGKSLRSSTMRDREFVNRFCAFQLLDLDDYRDMDEFLAQALTQMNAMSDAELGTLSTQFRTSLRNNFKVFGRHAFRKHTDPDASRSVLNASLWDVMSTGLSTYDETLVADHEDALKDRFYGLMDDAEFIRSITYGPNTKAMVLERFEVMGEMLQEVLEC